jgi:transposase InsO family protein
MVVARPVCLLAHRGDTTWRWHERYGHIHFDALRKLARDDMVRGLPVIELVEQLCDCCVATKQRRTAFPAAAKYRAQGLLDLVHDDLCGPITPATPGGRHHFLLLVDDKSRYMWVRLLSSKDKAPTVIKQWKVLVEAETGRVLRVLRTDHGGEFTSVEFGEWCAGQGVRRHLSAPYWPQQNGVVERRNQTVVAMARSLLKARGVPAEFWGEAVVTAVYLLNRAPKKSLSGKTPYEAWHDVKPAVDHLRTFGCVAHVKNVRPHLSKLENRSKKVVLLGYESGAKAYRVFDPVARRIHVSRDIVFDEDASWAWGGDDGNAREFVVNDVWAAGGEVLAGTDAAPTPPLAPTPATPAPLTPASTSTGVAPSPKTPTPTLTGAPATPTGAALESEHHGTIVDSENLDADHDTSCPVRLRGVNDLVVGTTDVPGPIERELRYDLLLLADELRLVGGEEPATFAEAE